MNGRLILLLTAWALTAAGLAAVALEVGGDGALVAGIALVLVASIPGVARLRRDFLDTPGLYILSTAAFFGVTTLQWLGRPLGPPPGVDHADVTVALLVVAAAILCFTAGSLVAGPPRQRPTTLAGEPVRHSTRLLIALWVIGAAATLVAIFTGASGYGADLSGDLGVSSSAEPILLVSRLASLAVLCAIVIHRYRPELINRGVVLTLIAAQVVLGLVAGFKGQALLAVAYLLLVYIGAARRIPWRGVGVAAVVLVFFIMPLVGAVRTGLQGGKSVSATVVHTVVHAPHILRPDRALAGSTDYLSSRLRHIDEVALIVRETPRTYPYAHGATYGPSLLLQAVPRALWPDKPVLDQTTQFAHTYWQRPETEHTATPMTQIGDLYRNFGMPGVLLGMLAIGVVVGLYQRWASRRATLRAEAIHIFVIVGLAAFTTIETEVPVLVSEFVKRFPITLLVAFMVFRPKLSESRAWFRAHAKPALATALVSLAVLAVAVIQGPLSSQRPGPALAIRDVVASLERHGGVGFHPVKKPATVGTLWNVVDVEEGSVSDEPVLVIAFDKASAVNQATGGLARGDGFVVHGNIVVLYRSGNGDQAMRARLEQALLALPLRA